MAKTNNKDCVQLKETTQMEKQDTKQQCKTSKESKQQKVARLMLGGPRCWKCKYFNRDLSLNFSVAELKAKGLGHCMFNTPQPVQASIDTFSRAEAYISIRPIVGESDFCGNYVLNEDAEY